LADFADADEIGGYANEESEDINLDNAANDQGEHY